MPLPDPPGNGIMPSVLGRFFVDAKYTLISAGLIVNSQPNLTLPGNLAQMLMADTTLITTDDMQDLADTDATQLSAPYVINQQPPPNTAVNPGATVQLNPAGATPPNQVVLAIGYPVPTPTGTVPVP